MQKTLLIWKSMLLSCFFFGNYFATAQSSSLYGFAESSGVYTAITGTVSTASGDDGTQNNLAIGFNFFFAGSIYTTFSITTNGFIRLGGAVGATHWTNVLSTTTSAPLLAPFWDDNNATGGNIQYMTTGSAGNQVLTVQWANIHMGGVGSTTTPIYSYQVKLYEISNNIEFVYGSASGTLTSSTASIGISGVTGDYLSVTPGSPSTVSSSSPNNGISSAVPANTVYTFTPPPPCSGTPSPGNTISSVTGACPGVNFTLSLQNNTPGTGVTYQWQTSPDGINWTNASSTASTFTTTQSATTYYQAVVTCANGSLSNASTPVMLGMHPFYNCYCAPVSNCVFEGIDSVWLNGFSNISSSCFNSNGYTDYGSMGSVASVNQGGVLSVVIKAKINSNPASTGAWIDYDHNGLFDAVEYTALGTAAVSIPSGGTSYIFSGNITVPVSAATGITRIRFRCANQNGITAGSSCIAWGVFGEFEDYLITINTGTPCFGTPAAGTLSANVTTVSCPSVPFVVSSTGYTTGATGVSFQWQSSSDGFNFTDVGPDTVDYYNLNVPGISQTMYYQLRVTCANGGGFDIAPAITVNYQVNPAPYLHDVEQQTANTNSVMNSCWSSNPSNTSTYAWHVSGNGTTPSSNTGPSAAYSGSKFFYTEASSGIAGAVAELIMPPVDVSGITSPQLEFWYHMYGVSTNKLVIAVWDGLAWQSVDSLVGQQQISSGASWMKRTVSLTGFPSPVEVKFVATRGSSFEGDISLDNISIDQAPACPSPTAPIAGNLTSASAELDWVENGTATQWHIEYGPAGFTPGTGTFLTVNAKPYILNGLTPSTQYTYYVKSLCSATDSSVNATGVSFYTTQIPVTVFPWIENWETGGTDWTILNGSQMNKWHVGSAAASNGQNGAYISNDNGTTNSYDFNSTSVVHLYRDIAFPLSSPAINLSFEWKGIAESCCDYMRVWLVSTSFTPIPGTLIASASGFLQLGGNYNGQSTYSQASFTIPPSYAGTTARLVFEWYNDGSIGPNPPVAIDSVKIEVANCLSPGNLAATGVTTNAATLSWVENGTATQWSIEYGPAGFTPGSGSFISTNSNPYNLTNLTANTNYSFYVRSNCSITDSSLSAGPYSFYTTQIPQTVFPYAQNFETGGGDWTYVNDGQPNQWYVGTPGANSGTGGLYVSGDAGLTSGYNNASSSVVHAYRDLDLTSFSAAVPLTFNANIVGEPGYDYVRIWMVPVSYQPIAGIQITSAIDRVQLGGDIAGLSGWTGYNLSIPVSFTGGLARLVVEWSNDGIFGSAPIQLDELTIGGFPLAIKLQYINAWNEGSSNHVHWKAASVTGINFFELERSSDGANFTRIATVNAKAHTSAYTYLDEKPVQGINYYRLKIVDDSKKFQYSEVVHAMVKADAAFKIEVYPNPVTKLLKVKLNGKPGDKATINIVDMAGKQILSVTMAATTTIVDLGGIASGTYYVVYRDDKHYQPIKITKQ